MLFRWLAAPDLTIRGAVPLMAEANNWRALNFHPPRGLLHSFLDVRPSSNFCRARGGGRGRCRNREHGGVFGHHRISAGSDSVCDINRHSIGLAQGRPGTATSSNWRSPCLHAGWPIDCQAVRAGAMGRGDGGRSGNGCNALEWHISSTCWDRSPCGGRQQYVVEFSRCPGRYWRGVARIVCLCLAQSRRSRR